MEHRSLVREATRILEAGFAELENCPLTWGWDQGAFWIEPKGQPSFPIRIYDEGDDLIVSTPHWHGHFEDPGQAGRIAGWLLTPFYRTVEEFMGTKLATTWAEHYTPAGWLQFEVSYYLSPIRLEDWT